MHEKSMPLILPETSSGSLADLPGRQASANPGKVTFSVRSGSEWTDVTAATLPLSPRASWRPASPPARPSAS